MTEIAAQPAEQLRPIGGFKRALVAIVVGVLGLFVIAKVITSSSLNWRVVGGYLFFPAILNGIVTTLELTLASMIAGTVIGTLIAVMNLSRYRALSSLSILYIWFFRGTPLLVQLIFWFNIALIFPVVGFGAWVVPINQLITPIAAALLGLSLNEGAYMAEIVRAGIKSVDRGQSEAAACIGLTDMQTMQRIVLPQALRVIIPPTGNQAIGMLKNTSLVSVIGAQELLTKAENVYARNFDVIELLIVASLWYLAITTIASTLQFFLERRFGERQSPLAAIAGVNP